MISKEMRRVHYTVRMNSNRGFLSVVQTDGARLPQQNCNPWNLWAQRSLLPNHQPPGKLQDIGILLPKCHNVLFD